VIEALLRFFSALLRCPVTGQEAGVKKIKERPDEIKRVIKAGIKANRHIHQNRDGTLQVKARCLTCPN